jgi:uncharacterized protein YndB with AHSA1/START domain
VIHDSSEVTIDRPPREVYEALLDPGRYAQWTDMVDMSFDAAEAPRVGTRGRFRLAKGPIKGMLDVEVTELEPDRRIVMRITHPTLDWTATSTLAPVGAMTHLTYAGEMRLKGWRRILEPIAAREARRGEAGEAIRLKRLLEAAPEADGSTS